MERFGAREEDCEGLVNYALSMGDVQVAIFFRELPDSRYRVSLRSKGEINVSRVAEHFGGGGHKCASGFSPRWPACHCRVAGGGTPARPASGIESCIRIWT